MPDYAQIGSRIRTLRKDGRLTQAQLGGKVGVSTSFMGHIERGTRIASLDTICSIAAALNISLDRLVLGKDDLQGYKEYVLGYELQAVHERLGSIISMHGLLDLLDEEDRKKYEK